MADFGYQGNFYGDEDAYSKFANLSGAQANQSLQAGDVAARYADPFMDERKKQIQRLETLQSNPGSIETSPFYKFLMDTQLNAVRAKNAATGNASSVDENGALHGSGRGLMALQDRAAGVASQAYFPLLQNASQLAQGGSSPSAAGIAYSGGVNRSQDQQQAAAAARAASQRQPQQQPTGYAPTPTPAPSVGATASPSYGLPSGGYSEGGTFGDPRTMSLAQLNAEAGLSGGVARYPDYANNQPVNLNAPIAPTSAVNTNFAGYGTGYDPSSSYSVGANPSYGSSDYASGGYDYPDFGSYGGDYYGTVGA